MTMFSLVSRKLARAVVMAALTGATPVTAMLTMSASPAEALCKYGTPHCVNPNPGPKLPKVGGAQIPDSGWEDPDCKYFHNCGYTGTK
jgi:hypothetical protein